MTKLITGAVMALLVGTILRPGPRIGPREIAAIGRAHQGLVGAMLGRDPRPFEQCARSMWYPFNDGWDLVVCPCQRGHAGLHADANLFPFFTDDDADWFNRQHDLCA